MSRNGTGRTPKSPAGKGAPLGMGNRHGDRRSSYTADELGRDSNVSVLVGRGEPGGLSPLSPEIERWWLPVCGPTTMSLVRHLSAYPHGSAIDAGLLARRIGLSASAAEATGRLWQAFDRAARFRFLTIVGDDYGVTVEMAAAVCLPPITMLGHYPAEDRAEFELIRDLLGGRTVDHGA